MSSGCGTLSRSFELSTTHSASGNPPSGAKRQHTLPDSAHHSRDWYKREQQTTLPRGALKDSVSRLWGNTIPTPYGGEATVDNVPEYWEKGEYWNRDSNIRIWGPHEIRRRWANGAHDIHRHDQIIKIKLPGSDRESYSGVLSADCCFLEAWGFDLGLRDRNANKTPLWRPPCAQEQFRSKKAFQRSRSVPESKMLDRTQEKPEHGTQGRTYGSVSHEGYDRYDHAVQREGARLSCAVHNAAMRRHHMHYPHDHCNLRPAAIYTLKYQKFGEDKGLRDHVPRNRVHSWA